MLLRYSTIEFLQLNTGKKKRKKEKKEEEDCISAENVMISYSSYLKPQNFTIVISQVLPIT